jgi:DNA helicase-2/ATP-dependent DNA helicase PcrA
MDLSKFNNEQREAITLPIDSKIMPDILVLAGAGSGKTRVIINRIAYLRENGVHPKCILGLTFTKKAANEMQSRLMALLTDRAPVKLSTFHALAADLLRTFKNKNFDIIDDSDQTRMMRSLIDELKMKDTVKLKDFKNWFSYQRNKCADPYSPNPKDDPRITGYRELANAYRKAKSHIGSGVYDFDDLLEELVVLLRKEPDVKKQLHSRWRYILVDEYQDTNRLQFNILKELRGEKTQLMQVGDEDQLIYSWRGAEIEHILKSYSESLASSSVHCVTLDTNYRCSGNILSTANLVVSANNNRAGKKLVPNKDKGTRVVISEYDSCYGEAEDIASTIAGWESEGVAYNEVAVLLRTNRMSRSIERSFIERGIPYHLHNGVALFDSREVQLMLALLRFTDEPGETFFFQKLLDFIKIGVGPSKLKALDEKRQAEGLDWVEFLKKDAKLSNNQRVKELLMFFPDAREHCVAGQLDDCAKSWLYNWDLMQFFKEEERDKRSETLLVFFDVLSDYVHHAENVREVRPTMLDFQEQRLLNDALVDGEEKDAVHVMSIHKSKGLEFQRGFVVGMQDGVFPLSPEDYDEEDVRLAYVAITRFMDELHITRARRRVSFDVSMYSSLLDPFSKELKKGEIAKYARF